jgi:hypothetical protein
MRKEYKRVASDDGRRRIIFLALPGDLFSWEEEEFVTETVHGAGAEYAYWTPCGAGGLYGTAAQMEAAARAEVPWLRSASGRF